MEHKTRTKALSVLLSLAMLFSLVPGMSMTATADSEVKYLDASGAEQSITDYTVFDSDTTTLRNSWYVVNSNVEINQTVSISQNTNLILCDGAKLTVTSSQNAGISASRGSLTIYAQSTSDNMGQLEVTSTKTVGIRMLKNLTINGGKIEAQGSNGIFAQDADITINGGNVTADGGIYFNTENNLTITGGKVTAFVTGADSGIDTDGEVIISGGNVSVTGDDNPAISGTVINSIAGTGWTNKAGTEGKADIAISTGQTLSYKKVQFPAEPHIHDFTYSVSEDFKTITATCSADNCPLDDGTEQHNHTATLTLKPPANLIYDGKAKAATVEGEIPGVDMPEISYSKFPAEPVTEENVKDKGEYNASIALFGVKTADGENNAVTASVTFTINDPTYTIYIPAKLTVENAGWNATAGVTASGEIAEDTKLTVTAASANEWALKSGTNEIGYYLATAEGGEQVTAWSFTAEELAAENGTNKPMGAVVEEYINKPAGDYADTVTFTASVAAVTKTITIGLSGGEWDGEIALTYADGDTWQTIIDRNSTSIYQVGSEVHYGGGEGDEYYLTLGSNAVSLTNIIDPTLNYRFVCTDN